MDFDALDAAFFSAPIEKPTPVSNPNEHWISYEHWRWLAVTKVFDEHRKKTGLRAIRKDQRERELESYLRSLDDTKDTDTIWNL